MWTLPPDRKCYNDPPEDDCATSMHGHPEIQTMRNSSIHLDQMQNDIFAALSNPTYIVEIDELNHIPDHLQASSCGHT